MSGKPRTPQGRVHVQSHSHPAALVVTLALLTAVGPFSLDAYLPALPSMAGDLGVPVPTIQLSLTACLLGLGVGQLIAGPFGDRFGRRRPILIGAAVYTLASLGCAVALSADLLILSRAVQGLAGAAGLVLARASVQDVATGPAAARMYSQMAVISGVAPVVAPVIGAGVFALAGWRAVFVFLGLLGVVLLLLVAVVLTETHVAENRVSAHPLQVLRGFADLLGDRAFRRFTLLSALMAATLFTYISSSSFVVQEQFGLGELGFALMFAGNGVGLSLAGMVNARLAGRVSPSRVLRTGVVVQLIGIAGVAAAVALHMAGSPWSAVVLVGALFVAIVPHGFVNPTSTACAMARSGVRAGSASALLGLSVFVVGAAVSPLSGLGDPAVLMVVMMAISGVLAVLAAWDATRHRV